MRNLKNLILCALLLVLTSTVAVAQSPIRLLAQYDFEGLPVNQSNDGILDPAPPSYNDSALIAASNLGIVAGSNPNMSLLDTWYRDGVVGNEENQMMSFQQGIWAYYDVLPEDYHYFEFSVSAVDGPIGITSICFLTGQNYHTSLDIPVQEVDGIIEYCSSGGALLGSDTFVIQFGLSGTSLTPVNIVPPTTLVAGTEPTFFRIRFNEQIFGKHSYTTQIRLDDVEVWSDPELLLARLKAYILEQVASGDIDPKMETSLLAKVDGAITAMEKGNPNCAKVAANKMKALANHAEAQTGKKIELSTAAQIIEQANMIIATLIG